MSVCATASIESIQLTRELNIKQTALKQGKLEPSVAKAPAMRAEAESTIIGKSFVTTYTDGDYDYNHFFNVVADGDSVILKSFAEGFDVKGAYDATAKTITIPTGRVIGEHSTYGPVTMYAAGSTTYSDDPIIGTISDGAITFNYGVYGIVDYQGQKGGLILMQEILASEANGKLTATLMYNGQPEDNIDIPLLITKNANNAINIVGLSSAFYNKYYKVPATFNATANTAQISNTQPVDWAMTSNGTGVKNIYYMFKIEGGSLDGGPEFNVAVTESKSTLTATSDVFLGYDTNGQGSYRGYTLASYKIEADFNIYTADVVAVEETEVTVEDVIYALDNTNLTATVTGCLGSSKVIAIKDAVQANDKTYAVTAISDNAFYANRTITSITIPASIKTVGTDAFRNLSNLKELHIADLAAWCDIEFANGNANPLYNLFSNFSERKWGDVYINNASVTELVIPEGVEKIGRAFYGFKKLTKVTLPSSLVNIGDQAFANCTKLTEIALPSSVKTIGSAFFGCEGLSSVTLNEGLETINGTVYGCKALTSLTIPSTVTTISGGLAFMGCNAITEIKSLNTIPPTCSSAMMFDDFATTAKLSVPMGSVDAYKAATGWSAFTTVEGIDTSAIDDVISDNDNAPVEYYNLQGVKVPSESLVPGIYVKKQGSKTVKIQVK